MSFSQLGHVLSFYLFEYFKTQKSGSLLTPAFLHFMTPEEEEEWRFKGNLTVEEDLKATLWESALCLAGVGVGMGVHTWNLL